MCRFQKIDLISFLLLFAPYAVLSVGAMITGGFGRYLFGWLAYAVFFFFVWEAYVLCRHCPYWAEKGIILRCHANYSIIKIWKYTPKPMKTSDKVQFIIGGLLLGLYPLPFLIAASQYLLFSIALLLIINFVFHLWKNGCSRCINFSCPINHVPKSYVDSFIEKNPIIGREWKK